MNNSKTWLQILNNYEKRFDWLTSEQIAAKAVFSLSAKPFQAITSGDLWEIIYDWWALDFAQLRWRVDQFSQIFTELWVDQDCAKDAEASLKGLDRGQALEQPIELLRQWDDNVYDLLTSMKRPDGAIQLTIMSQRESIRFINQIKQSSKFVNFLPDTPTWSSKDQQDALIKFKRNSWDLNRQEMDDAINCFKKSFTDLWSDLYDYEQSDWNTSWDLLICNNMLTDSLDGEEEERFLSPFDQQVKEGFWDISANLRNKLIFMESFFHNAIPIFLFNSVEWNIHILNWKDEWVLSWKRPLFETLWISEAKQRRLFAKVIKWWSDNETFIKTDKWYYSMQSKKSVTWWWQATLMPIWENILAKNIWTSPYKRLMRLCELIEWSDYQSFTRNYNDLNRLRGNFALLASQVPVCLENMKKWKLPEVWKAINAMEESTFKLLNLNSNWVWNWS